MVGAYFYAELGLLIRKNITFYMDFNVKKNSLQKDYNHKLFQ